MCRVSISLKLCLLLGQAASLAVAQCLDTPGGRPDFHKVHDLAYEGCLDPPTTNKIAVMPSGKRLPMCGPRMCGQNLSTVESGPCEVSCHAFKGPSDKEKYGCYGCEEAVCGQSAETACPSPPEGACSLGNFNRTNGLMGIYDLTFTTLESFGSNLRDTMRADLCKLFQDEMKCGGKGIKGQAEVTCDTAYVDKMKADFKIEQDRMLAFHERIRHKQYRYSDGCTCMQGNAMWMPKWTEWGKIPKEDADGSWAGFGAVAADGLMTYSTNFSGPYLPYTECNLACPGAASGDTSDAKNFVVGLGFLVLPLFSFSI